MKLLPILLLLFGLLPAFSGNQPSKPFSIVKNSLNLAPPVIPVTTKATLSDKPLPGPVIQRIAQVEQGLTTDILSLEGSPVKTSTILARLKYHRVNGLSVAVINNGALEWAKGYGVAEVSQPEAVTPETLFQTASVGKVITALAALKLVKEKKLALDEDVNQKLTSWKVPANKFTAQEKVTLRRLLSHSAGLADDYGFGGYIPGEPLPTLTQILNAQPPANNKNAVVVSAVPGQLMRYSGGGYVIMQQLIEDVTGRPFQAYVEQEIFQKLGLQRSTYNYYPDKNLNYKIARGHYANGKMEATRKYNVFPEAAAAGFWSTPTDLAKILLQIQKEKQGESSLILNQVLVNEMLTPQFNSNPRGLGVFLLGAQRPEGFGHSGNNPGYNSLLYATTATGQGAVVMVNSDEGIGLAQEVIRSIANVYKWPFMRTHLVKNFPKEQREKYTGIYRTKEGLSGRVGENKTGLCVKFSNPKATIYLYPIANHQFIIREDPDNLRFTFIPDPHSKVTELVLEKYAGTKLVLPKIK